MLSPRKKVSPPDFQQFNLSVRSNNTTDRCIASSIMFLTLHFSLDWQSIWMHLQSFPYLVATVVTNKSAFDSLNHEVLRYKLQEACRFLWKPFALALTSYFENRQQLWSKAQGALVTFFAQESHLLAQDVIAFCLYLMNERQKNLITIRSRAYIFKRFKQIN